MFGKLLIVLLTLGPAVAAEAAGHRWFHTRPMTPSAAALLAEAARLPAVKATLDALERSDVVVYITDADPSMRNEPPAYLRFVSRAGGFRYLIVKIHRWRVAPAERLACLGHELHHALEIAGAPEVVDCHSLATFYERIGWRCGRGQLETEAAIAMSRLVRRQVEEFGR